MARVRFHICAPPGAFCAAILFLFFASVCLAGNCQEVPSVSEPAFDAARAIQSISIPSTAAAPLDSAERSATAAGKSTAGVNSANSGSIEPVRVGGVDWKGVILQSGFFLSIEQGWRLNQPTTRDALKGPFFHDWFESVKATHGWGDADNFLTNYIGHPMEGAVTHHIFVQNDPRGRSLPFSMNSPYWKSRLKGTAWTAFYSTQFELGPISEASIGNVGYHGGSLSGWVDLIITPIAGLGWQVGEDALDKYLVMRIESWTENRLALTLARGFLNPTRSFANMMRLRVPWHRDSRPGIWHGGAGNR
jgi:hypothetical protein